MQPNNLIYTILVIHKRDINFRANIYGYASIRPNKLNLISFINSTQLIIYKCRPINKSDYFRKICKSPMIVREKKLFTSLRRPFSNLKYAWITLCIGNTTNSRVGTHQTKNVRARQTEDIVRTRQFNSIGTTLRSTVGARQSNTIGTILRSIVGSPTINICRSPPTGG